MVVSMSLGSDSRELQKAWPCLGVCGCVPDSWALGDREKEMSKLQFPRLSDMGTGVWSASLLEGT